MKSKDQSENAKRPGILRRLPRFRFSLGFFCLVVLFCGTLLGFWASRIRPLQKQWRDAEPIVEMQRARIETTPAELPGWMLSLMPERERGYIEEVQVVFMGSSDLEKERCLEAISKLPRIKTLQLTLCELNDKDCEWIAKIKTLERIDLSENDAITDEGIAPLLKLPKLNLLTTSNTNVTWKSHLRIKQMGLSPDVLDSDYDGLVKTTQRNLDVEGLNLLESPPFRGIAIEAGIANVEQLRQLKRMREIRLYISNDAVAEEMKVLEEVLTWPQMTSIEVYPGKQSESWRKRGCSKRLFDRTAQLLAGRTDNAKVYFGDNGMIEFDLNPVNKEDTEETVFNLGLYSTADDFMESVSPLPGITRLQFDSYSDEVAPFLNAFPKVRSLRLEPRYHGLQSGSQHYFAALEHLEDLTIKTHGNYHSLPWNFFAGWKSKHSLRRLHFESKKMWDKPSLKPLLEFQNLESIFVLTGRDDGMRSIEEIKLAAATEKPPPEAPEEGRFRWLLSKMAADVEKRFTPPKPGQPVSRRQ